MAETVCPTPQICGICGFKFGIWAERLMMENAQVKKVGSLLEPLTSRSLSGIKGHFRWRSRVESIVIPTGAILVSLAAFGVFCALAGADPFAVYASIYKAAFGSWYSFQNTLVRAAPLMLCSLGTAIP